MTQRIYQCCVVLHTALVANAPKDTWNLSLNSIRIVQESSNWYIAIGGEIAPYAVYTNEPWNRGKNPNEGWIERTINDCLPYIKKIMSGSISEAEIDEWLRNSYRKELTMQYQKHIESKIKDLERI